MLPCSERSEELPLLLESAIELHCEYDSEDDTLYAWVGDGPRPAITYETDDGHLVRLDPMTKEFVGVTILDFQRRWKNKPIELKWETEVEKSIPWLPFANRKRREFKAEQRTLQSLHC
jgi:hypothetical protein